MPTYEYECKKCNFQFEEFQSITAEPIKTCRKNGCRGRVRRLISSGGGLLFKGSGFYETDYRSDSYQKGAKAESKSDSNSKDSKDSKDSKSASDSSNNKSVKKKKVEKKN